RAQFLQRQAIDACAADMVGELAHLAESGNHTESEDAALARRPGLLAPYLAEHMSALGETAVIKKLVHDTFLLLLRAAHQPLRSVNHRSADRLGMKKYSPPRSTLKVWMPWMRRLTGCLGIVNAAASSCSPAMGSRSSPSAMKSPL